MMRSETSRKIYAYLTIGMIVVVSCFLRVGMQRHAFQSRHIALSSQDNKLGCEVISYDDSESLSTQQNNTSKGCSVDVAECETSVAENNYSSTVIGVEPVPVMNTSSNVMLDAEEEDDTASHWPKPTKSRFVGRVLDYRSVELPPHDKGGLPGELREWLVEPDEGYTAHIEEEYRPNDNGEMQLVHMNQYAANQVLLTLDGETPFSDFKEEMSSKGAMVKAPLMEMEKGAKIVAVMVPDVSFDAIERLRDMLASFNPNLTIENDTIRTVDRIPNDARYSSQWGLTMIQAPSAWDIRTDASSVVVAVIDTGVNYNHQDLSGNLWVRNSNAAVSNYRYGMKASGGVISGDPLDDNGHGSHCSGIIGAVGDNSTGVSGVAWNVKIMSCKNLDASGSGYTSDMVLCMEWARTNGAQVVSISQGGGGYNSIGYAAFSHLRSGGVIAVCAAGNKGGNNDTTPYYPASYDLDNIVAVAASTSSDGLASFSCYGSSSVDIAAPGVGIMSTVGVASCGQYESWDGTSMATPFVSGALALLKAQYPSYTYLQLIQKLYAGGDSISALSGKCSTGKRLNVYKALSGGALVSPAPTASRGTYSDRVVVSWPSVSGASYYRVYRATSLTGAKTVLGSWQTGSSYTDSNVTAGTTYYYWVCAATSSAGANQSAYGSYATGYAQMSSGDQWDPGDDIPSGGTTITPSTTRSTHGTHTLGGADTNDFFKTSLTVGRRYIFETTGNHDTVGELYDSPTLSNRVAYNDDIDVSTNRNFRIEYTPSVSGVYYLRVRNINSQRTSSGSYTLAYRCSASGDNWDPGDDAPSGGTLLTPTGTVQTHGQHTLSPTDLYDFFRISMTAGRTYAFESTGSYDMYGELFSSTSTNAAYRVAYNDDADGANNRNFRIEYTPAISQTYYLRVRRLVVGSDGAYSLKYSYTQPAQCDLSFCNYAQWNDSAMVTSATNTMTSSSTFQVGQTIWVCFQWAEANLKAVNSPITNWVQIVNQATGAERASCMWVYSSGAAVNTYYPARNADFRGLEAGAYTARIALNENGYRHHGVAETTYTNNVRTIPFTVVNPQKTLSSIAIFGNASISAKGSADYRCIANYSDGSTADVSPTWSITAGSSYATVNSSGRITANDTSVDRSITLQADFNGKSATKTIAIRGIGMGEDPNPSNPFPAVVTYPSAPMVVEGVVYINNVLAVPGDQIAAYSGDECRGVARIVANGRVTMGVNVAAAGERIYFKVWDVSEGDNGTVYNSLQTLAASSDPQGTVSSPIRIDAAANDPFGQVVPEPLVPPTIIEASVTIDGAVASAGDILAVFSGDSIVGKVPIVYSNQNGRESATCRPVMFFSGRKTLSFRLWDADEQKMLEFSDALTLSAGDVKGTVADPYVVAFTSEEPDSPCTVSLNSGWNLVSFSVLPDSPTPANVFSQVSSSVQYVSDVSGNLWGPAIGNSGLSSLRLGAGYWVRSSANNVTLNVEGHGDQETQIGLSAGWNLIGYTLQRAGQVADVLRTALASGKIQYITDQSGNVYPGGSLSNLRPGVGYWLRATGEYSLKFDKSGMATAAASQAMAADSVAQNTAHPFGLPVVSIGMPTVFDNVSVSLFGKMAAYGDYLAVYDRATDNLVSVQQINSENGTATFTIMGLRANDRFYFKVWNAASGLDSPEIFTSAPSADLTITNPDEPVTGLSVSITGTKPTYMVVYNLDGKGTRSGGGALTQIVSFGGSAIDPVVAPAAGFRFVGWDISNRSNIRESLTITALYEESELPPAPATYYVTYSPGSYGTGVLQTATKTKDVALTLKGAIFSRTGYDQTGWATSDGGEKRYDLGGYYTANAAVTLYPFWSVLSYTVTFGANGGTGGWTKSLAYGSAITPPIVTKTGYAFKGWTPAVAATVPVGGATYMAQWSANNYRIAFNANGGTVTPTSKIVTFDDTYGQLPVPSRTNYIFDGWYTAVGGGTKITSSTKVTTPSEQTLYAHWAASAPTVKPDGDYSERVNGLDWLYTIESGSAVIQNPNKNGPSIPISTKGSVSIPNALGGCKVTKIGRYAFYGCDAITGIVIPDGVTEIDDYALYHCSSLVSVKLPKSLVSIGDDVFNGCAAMSNIVLNDGLKRIGRWCFQNCRNLTQMEIPTSVVDIGAFAFANTDGLDVLEIPASVTNVYGGPLFDCSQNTRLSVASGNRNYKILQDSLVETATMKLVQGVFDPTRTYPKRTYYVPSGVKSVGYWSLDDMEVESIVLPASVEEIEEYAFAWCTNLKTIVFEGGEPKVPADKDPTAFYQVPADCTIIVRNPKTQWSVAIPGSWQGFSIVHQEQKFEWYKRYVNRGAVITGTSLYENISGDITIPAAFEGRPVVGIHNYAFFGAERITSVTIPPTVKEIGVKAFKGCSNLKAVNLPQGLKTLGQAAFQDCVSLRTVDVPKGIDYLWSSTFEGCLALQRASLPEGITAIGTSSFANCKALTQVNIPSTVKTIKSFAFFSCESLAAVTLPQKLATIEQKAFKNCTAMKAVAIPSSVKTLGKAAFFNSGLVAATVPGSIKKVDDYCFQKCAALKKVTLDAGVEATGQSVWANDEALESVTLPSTLKTLGAYAFFRCPSLKTLNGERYATTIGEKAFKHCASLTELTLSAKVTAIPREMCNYCAKLERVEVDGTSAISSVSKSAFSNCPALLEVEGLDAVALAKVKTGREWKK